MNKLTQKDCEVVVERLVTAIEQAGFGNEASFFIYGSYFNRWRDGLSDLDGIFYFSKKSPLDPSQFSKIEAFQSALRDIYKEFSFTRIGHFFADVFIQDKFHGSDGRFYIFDKEKTDGFKMEEDTGLIFGEPFLGDIKPVNLRHEQEIELAHGLHNLRNYLFFEIPRDVVPESLSKARSILKYFRILPRRVSIINGGPMKSTPDVLGEYDYLKHINYAPFMNLWKNTNEIDKLENFIKQWNESSNTIFRDCMECFEKTLVALVENAPMLSKY